MAAITFRLEPPKPHQTASTLIIIVIHPFALLYSSIHLLVDITEEFIQLNVEIIQHQYQGSVLNHWEFNYNSTQH